MKLSYALFCGLGLSMLASTSFAQTLFTVGNKAVSKDEFLRAYKKNNPSGKIDYSEKAVNDYLNLYAAYKSKVAEAEALKIDTIATVKSEIYSYKTQLAKNYLTDSNAVKKLVDEAYTRMQEDREVAHILINVRPGEDSLVAKQMMDSLYNQINTGKITFEEAAKRYSQDQGSVNNGGNIGWMTALQIVYPFENMAYNTQKGKISKVFRSPYGYHILKVINTRANRGQLEVAQILITKSNDVKIQAQQLNKVREISTGLAAGKKFEDLVAQYSEDEYSKNVNGVLPVFGAGKMTPEFEEAAYSLKNAGDVSAPINTEYGTHFIKLIKKLPLKPLVEIRPSLTRQVENDGRMSAIKDANEIKVRKELKYVGYPQNLDALIKGLPDDWNKKTFEASEFSNAKAPLFSIDGKNYSQYDFMSYTEQLTRGRVNGNVNIALRDIYKMYENKLINDAQVSKLEASNKEFGSLFTEYREGVLLFDLMDKNVWGKASKDNDGLYKYYQDHPQEFVWKPGFEGTIYISKNESALKQIQSKLNAGESTEDALNNIDIARDAAPVYKQVGRFEFDAYPKFTKSEFIPKKVTSLKSADEAGQMMVFVDKIHPQAEQREYIDARGVVTSKYQEYLEKQWMEQLSQKYPLKVNKAVLQTIIK